jgi:hypothetical protein
MEVLSISTVGYGSKGSRKREHVPRQGDKVAKTVQSKPDGR